MLALVEHYRSDAFLVSILKESLKLEEVRKRRRKKQMHRMQKKLLRMQRKLLRLQRKLLRKRRSALQPNS